MLLTTADAKTLAITGILLAFIDKFLGGFDLILYTLVIFMAIDYITGLIVAGVFKNSKKTQNGALESKAGFKGIVKKAMMLVIVLISYHLDMLAETTVIRTAVIYALIFNESISIIENIGLMGVPIPDALRKAIEMLKDKGDEYER